MAQYAGRASVTLNTHLFFKNRTEEVEGYVLFVRKNALLILVPKYGLEGTIYVSGKSHEAVKFIYNEEVRLQQAKQIVPMLIVISLTEPVAAMRKRRLPLV